MDAASGCRATSGPSGKPAGSGRKTTGPVGAAELPKEWEMSNDPLLTFLLAVIALCAVMTALSLLITAASLWRTAQRLNLLLAHGDDAVQEARRAFGGAWSLLGSVRNLFGVHRSHKRHVTNKRRVA